jgi:ribosomal protein S18 acetylase RimI-like enzyme
MIWRENGRDIMKAGKAKRINSLTDAKVRPNEQGERHDVTISDADAADLAEIIELDARITGFARADFWEELFRRRDTSDTLCVLVAADADKIIGYALGEVRSWPVRAPPCGWLYAIGVDERYRLQKCGSTLMTELILRFKQSGVGVIRTVIDMDDHLLMSFLRSFGMAAGPFVELEMNFPTNE